MITEKLTRREAAMLPVTVVVSLVAGMWFGIWLMPARSLNVPVDVSMRGGEAVYSAAYTPVPTELPVLSVVLVFLSLYASWSLYTREESVASESETKQTSLADGGEVE